MRGDIYQVCLILVGVVVSSLLGVFFYREIFPEYKIYQNDYIALEEFRYTYAHQAVPSFQTGVKQIVIEREDKGPAIIDRCISCHVALQIPYFSPEKIDYDPSGNIVRDSEGHPVKIPNDEYIWQKLDEKIAALRDEKVLDQLKSQGDLNEINNRLKEAAHYESLKTAHVGHQVYDVTKVLRMHPLMGNETYPFQFHPLEEYGCTSCHNGNGRGLVTDKAHGPVFDGTYEVEDTGHTQKFTESDPKNDPRFSHVFNSKPGEELIFQTEPLFVGALIQAKCVQCHQTSDVKWMGLETTISNLTSQKKEGLKTLSTNHENGKKSILDLLQLNKKLAFSLNSEIDGLTKNFQRGKELYLSQACYACHRITGFSRGGVGPELTRSGENYPWFLKRKLTWPQGDLATSTMPNMRLDSKEIEDIMTFLLAQKGNNRAVSNTEYKASAQAWEAGRKMSWEKPLPSSQVFDLRQSMTIFASQGCAACHRLQGFESNVGFAVEKESASFEKLDEQQIWFKKLFPEVVHFSRYDSELPGSEIVATIDLHAKEIDDKIVDHVRQNSLLEELNQTYPELLESLYSPFRYAFRAKDFEYRTALAKETDPLKIAELKQKWEGWKKRVDRVLMMYIQIYGLGRLIGPHLNWSGIYRSDEWLMEHFHNPSSHVPRSIMPVFPFDDTKFYALTHMLNLLAIRNRNALRQVWDKRGFEPSEAFSMMCSQCHGVDMTGNGVIAEWIYPIPKNLRSPDFLRNLTVDKAIDSIKHGVMGTPMPPWGEAVTDKSPDIQKKSHSIPILKESEIRYLTEWMFMSLPGGEVIRQSSDVPKWQYSPADIQKELEKEEKLTLHTSEKITYLKASAQKLSDSTQIDKESYSIKREFYTPHNIEQGEKFFLINCAVCHGNEGDGSGMRSQAMSEAKPRMLTNLDWINSHDDLRLLRSIKYGVLGTAMTPWGDLTNSLQRMQLVIFIRSLSEQQESRSRLLQALYEAFDTAQLTIEKARVEGSKKTEDIESEIKQLRADQNQLESKIAAGEEKPEMAVPGYQKLLELERKLVQLRELDQSWIDLKDNLKKERDLYYYLGVSLINKDVSKQVLNGYIDMIRLNQGHYQWKDEKLIIQSVPDEKIRAQRDRIVEVLNSNIDELKQKQKIIEGRIATVSQKHELMQNQAEISSYQSLKTKLITDTEAALSLANTTLLHIHH